MGILAHLCAGNDDRDCCSNTGHSADSDCAVCSDQISVVFCMDFDVPRAYSVASSDGSRNLSEADAHQSCDTDAGCSAESYCCNYGHKTVCVFCVDAEITCRIDSDACASLCACLKLRHYDIDCSADTCSSAQGSSCTVSGNDLFGSSIYSDVSCRIGRLSCCSRA